jgi:hypothetical protein
MENARVNITWKGQQGELPDPVSFDATDANVLQWATEAVQSGGVPGIDTDLTADFQDYIVERYPEKDGLPPRIMIRPKTPFGL